jgi:16S rRNA (cytosine967-C5)-methyltransferase
LVYSTCSSEPEENEEVVEAFLSANNRFAAIDLRSERPARFEALEPVLDENGVLRTTPDRHGLEAFYGAVLRRVK